MNTNNNSFNNLYLINRKILIKINTAFSIRFEDEKIVTNQKFSETLVTGARDPGRPDGQAAGQLRGRLAGDNDRAPPTQVPQAHQPDPAGAPGGQQGHDQPLRRRDADAAAALQHSRWHVGGPVGGRHGLDASELHERPGHVYHDRVGQVLAHGLQEHPGGAQDGHRSVQGVGVRALHHQVSLSGGSFGKVLWDDFD